MNLPNFPLKIHILKTMFGFALVGVGFLSINQTIKNFKWFTFILFIVVFIIGYIFIKAGTETWEEYDETIKNYYEELSKKLKLERKKLGLEIEEMEKKRDKKK